MRREVKEDAPIDVLELEEAGDMFVDVGEVTNLFVGDFAKEFILVTKEFEVGEEVATTFA